MSKVSFNYDQAAGRIGTNGWTNAEASPVSYAFQSSDATYAYFARFADVHIQAVEQALQLWSDVAQISFQRVGSGTSGEGAYSNSATMLFAGDTAPGEYAYGYFPGNRAFTALSGNVYLNTSPAAGHFTDLSNGSYDFLTIVHEIGHAIGLDHPGAYNGGGVTYANDAEYAEDSRQYTVMSYFDASETGASHDIGWNSYFAATPLLHDIAAVQSLYGARTTTRAGDTTYGFNSNAGRTQFAIASASEKVVFAIWDGGGIDTLDMSGYSNDGRIDLNFEAFSSVGGLTYNIAIARGAVIENAVGGTGADIIIGNDAVNTLTGGSGADALTGGRGNDVLEGGLAGDTARFTGALSHYVVVLNGDGSITVTDRVVGRDGVDLLWSVEQASFADGTFNVVDITTTEQMPDTSPIPDPNAGTGTPPSPTPTPPTTDPAATDTGDDTTGADDDTFGFDDDRTEEGTSGHDLLETGGGDDFLFGFGGNDKLRGGDGFDVLEGGRGRDMLSGGADGDTFVFSNIRDSLAGTARRDVITDFDRRDDMIHLGSIDSSTRKAGDQGFRYIGKADFHKLAGELRYDVFNVAGTARDKTIVEGDINGDGRADFQIQMTGIVPLSKFDFVL
ncbi:MAG: M10 family metallopeptidase C-terminal domain-containing protein [Hyphomicrobium sp.]